jgi:hypothetical protein
VLCGVGCLLAQGGAGKGFAPTIQSQVRAQRADGGLVSCGVGCLLAQGSGTGTAFTVTMRA